MALSIWNLLLKRNNQQAQSGDQGYYNTGGWSNYGKTNPEFWSNPQDTGYGNWGSLLSLLPGTSPQQSSDQAAQSSSPQQGGFSLLDILSQVQPSGFSFRPAQNYWRW